MSFYYKMTFSIISKEVGPLTTIRPAHVFAEGGPKADVEVLLEPTITPRIRSRFKNPSTLDILLVPGGEGVVVLERENDLG
jgi:hypothetical protein